MAAPFPFSLGVELRLLVCTCGVWSCFCLYGLMQESIFRYEGPGGERFTQTMFMLEIEHCTSALFSSVFIIVLGQSSHQSWHPFLKNLALCSAAQCAAKFSAVEALKWVSYPVQVLAKSSKTIPATIGCLLRGKLVTPVQWVSVLGISFGTCAFSMVSSKTKGGISASNFGLLLLGASLSCDGTVAYVQEALRTQPKPLTSFEQMLICNLGAALLLAPFVCWTGQLQSGVAWAMVDPGLMNRLSALAFCSALGQVFVFMTVVSFGADTTAKVTTSRKMVTAIVSILWFGHTLLPLQCFAVLLILASVLFELGEQAMRRKECGSHGAGGAAAAADLELAKLGARGGGGGRGRLPSQAEEA